ncbi:hypothetical protein CSUI_009396 [Cystoisospora suis]|uniref:Uncharacterized protein n=1 Tax=Cystoisospora suis TaxID=483139 RepID=A0A2C6KJH3_9APIC|nr:hypothetical protein CSUI_009396 [Cystoisospora suis]
MQGFGEVVKRCMSIRLLGNKMTLAGIHLAEGMKSGVLSRSQFIRLLGNNMTPAGTTRLG